MSDPVIIVFPTIMDGTVVRWYLSESAAENGREVLSASCNGVMVNGYLTDIPPAWLNTARSTYETLKRNDRADVSHLATHQKSLGGRIWLVGA